MKKRVLFIIILFLTKTTFSQFNIGTNTTNTDAVLQLTSADSSQGVITPVVTTTNRPTCNATNEAMLIYNITDSVIQYCNGTVWVNVNPSALEDLDKDTKVQVEESADEDKIRFDTKGVQRMIIDDNGNIGIGTDTPHQKFVVNGPIIAKFSPYTASTNETIGLGVLNSIPTFADGVSGNYFAWLNSGYGYSAGHLGLISRPNNASSGIVFFTGGDSDHKMYITGGGGVGIGSGTPAQKFHVMNIASGSSNDFVVTASGNIGIGTSSSNRRFYIRNDVSGSDSSVVVNHAGNVGIGTTSPSVKFVVDAGTSGIYAGAIIAREISNTSISSGGSQLDLINDNLTDDNYGKITFRDEFGGNGTAVLGVKFTDHSNDYGAFQFWTRGVSGGDIRMHIDEDGNVGIATTSPSEKLHLEGSLKMVDGNESNGYVMVSDANGVAAWTDPSAITAADDGDWVLDADTLYSAPDSTLVIKGGNVGVGTTAPTANLNIVGSDNVVGTHGLLVESNGGSPLFSVRNNGTVGVGLFNQFVGLIPTSTGPLDIAGRSLRFQSLLFNENQYGFYFGSVNGIMEPTSGTQGLISTREGFGPTSGNAEYNVFLINTYVNQTGGANGITRGLFVNPVIVVAADWRSIETANNSGYQIYAGGTARSYFNGNVGIGTTAPDTTLHIEGSLKMVDGSENNGYVMVSDANGVAAWTDPSTITAADDGDWVLDADTLYSAPDSTVVIKGGNVGVGTTDPSYKLHVNSGTSSVAFESGGDNKLMIGYDADIGDWIQFRPEGANGIAFLKSPDNPGMVLNTAGNVGVGTVSPDEKLHLEGSLKMVDGNQSNGYVMVSDANGVATWMDPSTVTAADDGDWVLDGDTLYSAPDSTIVIKGGNVGIGTINPEEGLHVRGGSIKVTNERAPIRIESTTLTDTVLAVSTTGNNDIWIYRLDKPAAFRSAIRDDYGRVKWSAQPIISGSSFNFESNNSVGGGIFSVNNGCCDVKFRIDDNGNVGIGSSTVSAKLHVHNDNSGADSTFVVTSAGNVGIGTTSPVSKLQIHGGTGATSNLVDFYSVAGGSVASPQRLHSFYYDTDGDAVYDQFDKSGVLINRIRSNGASHINSGNFGIGTTSPTAKFHIHNDNSGTDSAFVVTAAGKVGIGTAGPSSRLDVYSTGTGIRVANPTNDSIIIGGSVNPYMYLDIAGSSDDFYVGRDPTGDGLAQTSGIKQESNNWKFNQYQESDMVEMSVGNSDQTRIKLYGREYTGNAGAIEIFSDNVGADEVVGDVTITAAGSGGSTTNFDGGDVVINGGPAQGAGQDGDVIIATARGNVGVGTTAPTAKLQIEGGALVEDVVTIAADDTTPDVSGGNTFITSANTGATVITDLDNPVSGQIVRIVGGSNTNASTIADAGNFNLSAAWTASEDDVLIILVIADNNYIEIGRVDN